MKRKYAYPASGRSKDDRYWTWAAIKTRCYNPKHECYPNYGGRGIIMCDEWLNSFEAFAEHVGPRPSMKHSIDRIDSNGNYEPGNVRWATRREQQTNMRTNNEVPGVGYDKKAKRWRAYIYVDKKVFVKTHATKEAAIESRKQFEAKYVTV